MHDKLQAYLDNLTTDFKAGKIPPNVFGVQKITIETIDAKVARGLPAVAAYTEILSLIAQSENATELDKAINFTAQSCLGSLLLNF